MELWEAGEGEEVVLQQVHSFTHSKKILPGTHNVPSTILVSGEQ